MSRRRPGSRRRRGAWIAATLVAVAAVLALTLRPDDLATSVNLQPLEHHGRALRALVEGHPDWQLLTRYLVTDVLGNIVLFVPLGLTIAGTLGPRPPAMRLAAAGGCGLALSVAIELVQLGIPGRASDVDDVIFNTLGAALGVWLHALAARRFARRRRGARANAVWPRRGGGGE